MPPRSSAARPDADVLRLVLVAAGRRLGVRGLISAGEGNVSVRLGEALLITPGGRRKDELAADDIMLVGLTGDASEADRADGAGLRPSSDVAIHRAVYAARPDTLSVAHAHLPASMALTLAGQVPDPAALPETAALLPRVPLVPFGEPGSEELAGRVAAAFAEGPAPLAGAVLLERHGAVATGQGGGDPVAAVVEAVNRLELVEVLCRTWRDALLVRAAATLGDAGAILRAPEPGPGSTVRGTARREP